MFLSIAHMGTGATTVSRVILLTLLGAWAVLSFIAWRKKK